MNKAKLKAAFSRKRTQSCLKSVSERMIPVVEGRGREESSGFDGSFGSIFILKLCCLSYYLKISFK